MSKSSNVSKEEEKVITIGAEKLVVPLALILVVIIVAVILFSGSKEDSTSTDINTDTSAVEGTTDTSQNTEYDQYVEKGYITEGVSTSIDDDPYLGDRDTAKIAIIEFSDYLCPYCHRHTTEVMPDIISNYVDTGEAIYVYRDLQIHGEEVEKRAQIGECVNEIAGAEKFFEYHEELMVVQFEEGIENPDIYAIVSDLGVDDTAVKQCYETGKYVNEIAKDATAANAIGISGTPGFVVGILNEDGTVDGIRISGALPFGIFQKAINDLSRE